MKKITALSRSILCISLFIASSPLFSQSISTRLFGQNAWMPDTIGNASACPEPPCILYGKLHQHWSNVQNSSAAVIRFGGIAPDRNKPTNFQYIRMIDSIRAKGMEPVIQVPFYDFRYTASQAAAIVQYVNVTKGKNIKYWIIGNEPDLKYAYTSAAQVAAYFKPFASAMKNVDPTILIIGPECAWYNSTILNGLTTPGGPDDITGTDAAGRYYLDIISFHYYPFNGTQTRPQVITKLTSPGALQDNLLSLNNKVAAANAYHGRVGPNALKTAITEANVNWKNSMVDDATTLGANSFIGGQFVAEMYGIGMKRSVEMITMWSVVEGNTTELNIGYIDKTTGNKKPLFHHYKLLADYFKGTYLSSTDNLSNVKTIACKNGTLTNVMIMNQELSGNYNYTLRLNNSTVSGTDPLKINVNAAIAVEYNGSIPNQSTFLLVFNAAGTLIKKCEYTLANHALLNLGPTCIDYLASPLPVTLLDFNASLTSEQTVALSWATATQTNNDYFTVQRTTDGVHFTDVTIVDGAGTTSEIMSYTAEDLAPLEGVSYYRLKQTDFDGTSAYYGMEEISLGPQTSSFLIYPNPSEGEYLNVDMNILEKNFQLSLEIFDVQGRQVYAASGFEESGQRSFKVILPEKLGAGVYFITAAAGNTLIREKFIVR